MDRMPTRHFNPWFRLRGGRLLLLLLGALSASSTRADLIVLRGGGQIHGVVLPGLDDSEKVLVLTKTSSKPFEFTRRQIERIDREEDALREYLERSRKVEPTTAEDQYQLGIWCEQNGLTGPALIHFRKAVELDPTFGPAQKKVGHVFFKGRWMTYDEQREAQGLIKYKGRWVSKEEKEGIDQREAMTAAQASWARRLKLLRQKALFGDEPQRKEAESQLSEIRDPAAVLPLVQIFGADPDPVRIRMTQLIAAIPGDEAFAMLVRLILSESSLDVRQAALDELDRRRDVETVPRLIQALRSKDPIVVGRAAWALGMLNAVSAVPKLIPVLVKVEQHMVMDPTPQPNTSVTFGSIGPGPVLPPGAGAFAVAGGASGVVGPGFVAGGGSSIPIVTGPYVAPGAVAYGATSVPFGSFSGFGVGGGVNPNRPAVKILTTVYQNEEVLVALQKLTGVNFGYDIPSWKRWLNLAYRPEAVPSRRVPQP